MTVTPDDTPQPSEAVVALTAFALADIQRIAAEIGAIALRDAKLDPAQWYYNLDARVFVKR